MRRRLPILAVLSVLAAAGPAAAAVPNDAPEGAVGFEAASAANGPVGARERVVDLDGAGPDVGVSRCLGPRSFQRTAWLVMPAAAEPRRVSLEAVPVDGSTAVPDLAAFVQQDGTTRAQREPSICSGRETAGDGSRGDEAAAVQFLLAAGEQVLVQVGLRTGDRSGPVLVTLAATGVLAAATPLGRLPGQAPRVAVGRGAGVSLRGATLAPGDPAQPRCQSAAAVWRRVRLPRRGYYRASAVGEEASTLTAFRGAPRADSAVGCDDDAGRRRVGVTLHARGRGTFWLRVGTDRPDLAPDAAVAVLGPYHSAAAARAKDQIARRRATAALPR